MSSDSGSQQHPGMLPYARFAEACTNLRNASEALSHRDFEPTLLHDQHGSIYLRLTRELEYASGVPPSTTGGQEECFEEVTEDDDDAAVSRAQSQTAHHGIGVEYNVIFSTVYRVPVMYFNLHHLPLANSHSLEAVFAHLVPSNSAQRLRHVGVMGGISATHHPVTDMTCFFVHPCNTAEAMKEIIGTQSISSVQYLQIWFGLIGACVGLNLPIELAARM